MSDSPETNEFVPHDEDDLYSDADGTHATDGIGAPTVRDQDEDDDKDDDQASVLDAQTAVIDGTVRHGHDELVAITKHLLMDEDKMDVSQCDVTEDDLATHREPGGGCITLLVKSTNDEDQSPGGGGAELASEDEDSDEDSDDSMYMDDDDDDDEDEDNISIYEDGLLAVNIRGYHRDIDDFDKVRYYDSDHHGRDDSSTEGEGEDADDDGDDMMEKDKDMFDEHGGGLAILGMPRQRGGLEKSPTVSPADANASSQQSAISKSIFDDGYKRKKGGTDRRQLNLIPHALTNQLAAGMKGTMDLHKYIVERTIRDIMDTKPFLEPEATPTEKNEDEKEMEITESYNPQVLHALIVGGRDSCVKMIHSQAKKYVDHMLKAINDLHNFGKPEYDKSRRVTKKKGHVSDAKFFQDRVAENIKALRGVLHRNKVENVSEDKLKSEFTYELIEYESHMRENVAQMARYQKKLVEDIMEKIRDAQSARLVPVKRLSLMPRSLTDSTDHAATPQHSLFVRLLKEVEDSVNENRQVAFQEVDLTNLVEGEDDNMTIEDLSDRDSFVMPERVRKVVDECEVLFVRLIKQQLVLAGGIEEVMMELLLKEASKSDPKLKELVIEAENDHKENRERANSENVRGSGTRGSQAHHHHRSNRPSERDATSMMVPRHSIKIRKYMLNRLRKVSIGTIEKAFLDEGRQDVLVSDEVDLAFRRTIANHISTVKHLIELVLAKQADSKIMASSAEASLGNLKQNLETYQKKANEIQPPPAPWNPEEENPLYDDSDDATPAELADHEGRSRSHSQTRTRSRSRTRSSTGPNTPKATGRGSDRVSESRSGAGMSVAVGSGMDPVAHAELIAMGFLSTTSELHSASSHDFFAAPVRAHLQVDAASSEKFDVIDELDDDNDDFEDAREDIEDESEDDPSQITYEDYDYHGD